MPLPNVYTFCRPWAVADDPYPDSLQPVAPYAQLSAEAHDVLKSSSRSYYAEGWSKEISRQLQATPTAGMRPPQTFGAGECLQHGGIDVHALKTNYQSNSDPNRLDRYHRKSQRSMMLSPAEREARWYKCFFSSSEARSKSAVTGTEFSMLPAGYQPKTLKLPAEKTQMKDKYRSSGLELEESVPEIQTSTEALSPHYTPVEAFKATIMGNRSRKLTQAPSRERRRQAASIASQPVVTPSQARVVASQATAVGPRLMAWRQRF